MASRRSSRSLDELHVEELDEPQNEVRRGRRSASDRPSSSGVSGGAEATVLQLAGTAGVVGGLGLWLGAGFHAGLAEMASSLGSVSLHPGTLAVSGLMLLAFGRIRRGQVRQAQHDESHDDGLLEQVATNQVHSRNALEKLSRGQSEIVDTLRFIQGQLQALSDAQVQPTDDSSAQEAIFRLAASLDQMGARVEQRMQAQYESFQTELQQVGSEIVAAQSDLREFLAQLPPPSTGAESDPWSEPLPQAEQGQLRPPPEPQPQDPPPSLPATPQTHSLGVLDTIPDETVPPLPSARQSPAPQPTATPFQGHTEGIQPESEPSPAERALELDTHTKLTQLSDLLADDRLRAALEDMRRNS